MRKWAENAFRHPLIIAFNLILFGFILLLAEELGSKQTSIEQLSWTNVIWIGIAQALAIIPGVSRSGITIITGLACGLKRDAAARFSFLMAAPVMLGAGLYKLKDLVKYGHGQTVPLFTGFLVVSAVVGFIAIAFLLDFLKKHSFRIIVWYRVILGVAVVLSYYLLIK